MAIVHRKCCWCGSQMPTSRQTKKYCSQRCANQFNYALKTEWSWLTVDEFHEVIQGWLANGCHPNPAHPINVLDKALAEAYRNITTALEAAIEQGGTLNA